MKKTAAVLIFSLMVIFGISCTQQEEQKKETKPQTLREKAAVVGRFSDRTMTRNLEKSLPDIVDKAEQRAKELDKAAESE